MKKLLVLILLICATIGYAQELPGNKPAGTKPKAPVDSRGEQTTPPAKPAQPAQSAQQQQPPIAKVDGNNIILPDGRILKWQNVSLNTMGVKIEMVEPAGAMVTLSYDSKDVYSSDVPFIYDEKDWNRYNTYVRLSVVETNGTSWSVKLKNVSGTKLLVGAQGASNNTPPPPPPTDKTASSNTSACGSAMSASDFQRAYASIEAQTFEADQIKVFKQIITANCLSTQQVVTILDLFIFEQSKLKVAKMAYPRTADKNNFYQVNDAFTFSSSISDLNKFLESQGQ